MLYYTFRIVIFSKRHGNLISGVMVSVLASRVVERSVKVIIFNAIFYTISANGISWWSDLLVEETGV